MARTPIPVPRHCYSVEGNTYINKGWQICIHELDETAQKKHVNCDVLRDIWPLHFHSHFFPSGPEPTFIYLGIHIQCWTFVLQPVD